MIDLTALTTDDLRMLIARAQQELASRAQAAQELITYTHECWDASRNHHARHKHWAKLVTSVDTSKANGYAWQGEFLPVTREAKIAAGSIVVEVCGDVINAYRITPNGKERIGTARTNAPSALIQQVASLL